MVRGNVYSIMCNENTDVAIKEQPTFCLPWVNKNLKVHQKFLGFYIPDNKSAIIVSVIKDTLIRYQLSLDSCRDRCYDCASNIYWNASGVAVQIKTFQSRAYYLHCHTHSLSLATKDVTKTIKISRDIAGEIIVFVKYFPKYEKLVG